MRRMFFAMIFSCCFFSITAMAEQYHDSMCYEYFDTQPMPQIADLKDIKIYGVKSSGVVVCIGNKSQYFDWIWQNSIYKLPTVYFDDMDNDGEKELCYIANLYQGVGTYSQQLYILDIVERDAMFDVVSELCKMGYTDIFIPGYLGWSPKEGSGIFDPLEVIPNLCRHYYRMDRELCIDKDSVKEQLKERSIFLVVNYFGFRDPQIGEIMDFAHGNDCVVII